VFALPRWTRNAYACRSEVLNWFSLSCTLDVVCIGCLKFAAFGVLLGALRWDPPAASRVHHRREGAGRPPRHHTGVVRHLARAAQRAASADERNQHCCRPENGGYQSVRHGVQHAWLVGRESVDQKGSSSSAGSSGARGPRGTVPRRHR